MVTWSGRRTMEVEGKASGTLRVKGHNERLSVEAVPRAFIMYRYRGGEMTRDETEE